MLKKQTNKLKRLMYNLELKLAKIVPCLKNSDKRGSFKGEITWGFCGLIMYILGEGKGNPLQDYCLENHMDRGAW